MNANFPPQKGDPGDEQTSFGVQKSINPFRLHEVNITDGGEFLDDSIRMIDQPFGKSGNEENQ
jgi:hypothetical protein